jgi:flagellin
MIMSMMSVGRGKFNIYSHIASGKRINSAKDDAAGLAIAKRMKLQETGLNVGAQNAQMGIGALNTADGALDGVTDYLQRIRDLAVRSMNGTNSPSDKAVYQREIDQMKQGIQSLAEGTTLNEQKLLDGSMADLELVTNPNGGSRHIQMADATLEALGIADLDVTSGDFSLETIDKALDMVSAQRGSLGASTNGLERAYNYNTSASQQQLKSRSGLEDLDFPKAVSEKQKKELLFQYQTFMLKKKMEEEGKANRILF